MAEAEQQRPLTAPIYRLLTENSDIFLAVSIISILMLMVIPLPPWVLDLLLTVSITSSMVILMISLYIVKPLDLAVFPGLLLILTLLRLALNVASTRLILGEAYAGRVIESFGNFVVKGDYVVGFIIFLIIVLINFIVIVKGAGRIAEVAARFTLDAMPGKQMAIDADLNAGIVSDDEARERRAEISREAEFYGAMDGASKFVKGDAIAGLVIAGINILGGFLIGVVQRDLSFQESLSTYTLLTIGDGLVTQIPALIISSAAGLIVTRAATVDNLGQDIQRQLLAQPKALFIASAALFLFGVTPGMPSLPFLVLSALVFFIGYMSKQSQETEISEIQTEAEEAIPEEKIESYLQVDPMELEIGYGLIPLVDVDQNGDLLNRITAMRKQLALEIGIIVPPIRIRDNIQLDANDYVIKIRGVEIANGQVLVGQFLAMNPGTAVEEIEGTATTEPAFGLPAYWITEAQKEKAEMSGYTVVEASAVVATHLMEIIKTNADRILSRQDTQTLINNVKESNPTVVEELVPSQLTVGAVQKILQNLLRERLPIRDLVTILETLSDYVAMTKDADILTEYVRQALNQTIAKLYADDQGIIHAITLDPKLERMMEESFRQGQQLGTGLTLPPDQSAKLYENISKEVDKMIQDGKTPMVITGPNIRAAFRRFMSPVIPQLIILSYAELTPNVQVQSVGGVTIQNGD